MICRLCLCNADNYFNFFDSYGLNSFAVEIVSKHFWFEPKIDDAMSNFICVPCWETVKHFHDLYENVEKAHKLLTDNILCIKSDPGEREFINNDQVTITENKDNDFDWNNIDFDRINCDLKTEEIDVVEETVEFTIFEKEENETSLINEKSKIRRGRKRKKKG